jgi:hypothetical protein
MADPNTRYYAFKLFPPRPSFPADTRLEIYPMPNAVVRACRPTAPGRDAVDPARPAESSVTTR